MISDILEKTYRTLKVNSYSSLKTFSVDRRKYYKKYILDETIKEKETKAANMGRIVETLLWEPKRFDELFFMSTCVKIPGGMLGEMIDKLAELVSENTSEEGTLMGDFMDLAEEAYNNTDYKLPFKTVIKKLDDPENELYYQERLKVEHLKMTMVTAQDIENAEQIVNNLQTNDVTSHIVTVGTSSTISVYDQPKITDYYIDGIELKSMLDRVIVHHPTKTIIPYDLKCIWAVENFFTEYYLYRRTYIQSFLYTQALKQMTEDKDHEWYGYTVENLKFIVCDSINYYDPLIYTLSEEDMRDAYEGFTYKDKKYPGVRQIIEELKWAIENDKWTISKANFDKKGLVNIRS